MKELLLKLNKALLFACVSMYFGTGWSLVLFSFPTASELTPENYYNQFVPQVTAATKFFTYMTMVMIASCVVFIIEEWRTKIKLYPIGVLLLVIAATLLTMIFILPYNQQMAAGIKTQAELQEILGKWMNLNIVRVLLWTGQWLLMMAFYVFHYNSDRKKQ